MPGYRGAGRQRPFTAATHFFDEIWQEQPAPAGPSGLAVNLPERTSWQLESTAPPFSAGTIIVTDLVAYPTGPFPTLALLLNQQFGR